MKKTTRLTALLLALVLLLANISASATETNENIIPLDSLTADVYAALLADAEVVGLAAGRPCGSNNPYCASVTKLVSMATAQERYLYLAGLSSVEAIGVLMHYNDYKAEHTAEGILCLCGYPNFYAEHVPGHIDAEHTDCPWHFANMTVNEQYHILMKLDATEQATYKAALSEDQLTQLEKFSREIEYYYPCDPDTCPIAAEYNVDFFAMDTFYLYEYLDDLRDSNGEPSGDALKIIQHLRNNHVLDDTFCQCEQFTFVESSHKFGRSHHSGYTIGDLYIDCPWRFDRLTTAEQAQVLKELEKEGADNAYAYALLSDKQKAELNAFIAGVGKTEETITAKDPDNAEETLVTANITVPEGVFGAGVTHVMEAGEALMTTEKASALNQIATGHTLAAFDISFYNLDRPGEKLQPVNGTVPLTFTVDVSAVEGDSMQVYHLIENADGSITAEAVGESIAVDKANGTQEITIYASAFSTYALRISCTGDGAACGYNEFIAMNGFDRHTAMANYVNVPADMGESMTATTLYQAFIGHLNDLHVAYNAVPPYCVCADYEANYENMGYGSINHGIDSSTGKYCAWHFSQLSVVDEYTVYQGLSDEKDPDTGLTEKETYLATITDAAKKAELMELINPEEEPETLLDIYKAYQQMTEEEKQQYLAGLDAETRDKLLRINVSSYTASAANSSTVSIAVPEGAFGEDYLLNVMEAEVTAEIQSALDALAAEYGEERVDLITAFDISFGNLATEQGMQPGAAVELAFDIPTASISEDAGALAVFHIYRKEFVGYVAELVGDLAIDKSLEMQTIAVDATAFSIYVVGSVGSTPSGNNRTAISMSVGEKIVLYSDRNINYTGNWRIGSTNLPDGQPYTYNNAYIVTPNGRYVTVEKIADGEMSLTYRANSSNDTINFSDYPKATFRPNGGGGSNYTVDIKDGAFVFPTIEEAGITPPEGMKFGGWSLSADSKENTYSADIQGTSNSAVTYYAVWYNPTNTQGTSAYFHILLGDILPYEPAVGDIDNYTSRHGMSGTIRSPIAINNNLDAVAGNILTPPTRDQINAALRNAGQQPLADDETIVWYVIKWNKYEFITHMSSDWHVDGVRRKISLYNVTYHPNGGNTDVPGSAQYAKNETVNVSYGKSGASSGSDGIPSRTGYVFLGWDENPNAGTPTYNYSTKTPASFTMPDHDVDLYAIWKPADGTKYEVIHHLMDADDNEVRTETSTYYGTTDAEVSTSGKVKTYEGYAYAPSHEGSVHTGKIQPDGSLKLHLYYVRAKGNLKVNKVLDDPTFTSGTKYFSFKVERNGDLPTADEFEAWAESKQLDVSNNAVTTAVAVVHPAATGYVLLENLPTGSYKITEVNAEGYETTYAPENGIVTVTAGDTPAEITVTNKSLAGSLKVSKIVPAVSGNIATPDPDQQFHFTISLTYPDGTTETKTATLKNGEQEIFDNLPAGTTYTVTETPVDYFTVAMTGDSGTIAAGVESSAIVTNTYTKLKTADLTIRKGIGVSGLLAGLPSDEVFEFEVNLTDGKAHNYTVYEGNEIAGTGTISANGTGTIKLKAGQYAVIKDVAIGSSYTVDEKMTPEQALYFKLTYSDGITGQIDENGSEAIFVNTYYTGSLKITKVVKDSDFKNGATKIFTFDVTGPVNRDNVQVKVTGTDALEDSFSATLSGLPEGEYTVVETPEEGYTTTYEPASQKVTVTFGKTAEVTVTNTAKATITVTATKEWDDNSNALGLRPADVALTLYANGTAVTGKEPTVTKNDDNTWTYTWTGVDKYDTNGQAINYTVDEANVPKHYTKSASGMTVTNSIAVGNLKITKRGLKEGDSAIFNVQVDGKAYTTVVLTGGENGAEDSILLVNLPAGKRYSVIEDGNWSKRYNVADSDGMSGTITAGQVAEATIVNEYEEGKWLDDEGGKENVFTGAKDN